MNIDVYNPYSNHDVTSYYIDTIIEALTFAGHQVHKISKISYKKENLKSAVLVVAVADSIKARIFGYGKVILWAQGVIPEESFVRNRSKFRRALLSIIEKVAIRSSNFLFLVSEAQVQHYERKYKISMGNYMVMPCFNEELKSSSFFKNDKYKKNIFIYAGGLQPWQCFRETAKLYKLIENAVPDTHFRVLVRDKNAAELILKENSVKNYSIDFVPQERVYEEFANAKFGFCLRKDIVVNNVSTPTKLSSYVANGVLPIYSKSIGDFSKISASVPYCFAVDASLKVKSDIDNIISACDKEISASDVFDSFTSAFGLYYSKSHYVEKMVDYFRLME